MIKKTLLAAALTLVGSTAFAQAPAFPGAEGHGRYVTGGRGGKIIHVTNLNDSGEGSLRWALSQSGARTIVFDVSGTIELKSDLKLSNSNVSILGQTAPGEGITIAYYTFNNNANNVIMRFIRFRRSQVKDVNDGADGFWGRNRNNIILDHCSASWSIDEIASWYDNREFSMQWCLLAEGLCNPGHSKGAHSYGGIWGGKPASFHHSVIAHVQNRSPRFNGARYESANYDKNQFANTVLAENVDFRNNLLYNWGNGAGSYGGPGGGQINIVNNYYKAGPGTKNKTNVTQVSVGNSGNSTNEALRGYASRYFVEGNYVTAASTPEDYDWKGVSYDGGLSTIDGEKYIPDAKHLFGENATYVKNTSGVDCVRLRLEEPTITGEVTTHTAQEAYKKILQYAGACLFKDAVDIRIMEEARTGTVTYNGKEPYIDANGKKYATSNTAGIPDWVNDPAAATQNPNVPSFPVIKQESRPDDFDSDGDGMPDIWELANGLDPNNSEDGNLYTIDTEKGWYTNFEVYANSIVEHIIKAQNADAIDPVDEYFPIANNQSGIVDNFANEAEIVGFEYYNLQGIRLEEPAFGINIRRIIYSDGTVTSDKVIKNR